MPKFVEVEEILKPYKDLQDCDVISIWLLKENIKQQPAAEVVSKEYFDTYLDVYIGLVDSAVKIINSLREIIRELLNKEFLRKENKEI